MFLLCNIFVLFYSNNLSGAIPDGYSFLSNLYLLTLQRNDLTGTINGLFCPTSSGSLIDTLAADCLVLDTDTGTANRDPNITNNNPEISCTCCICCHDDLPDCFRL